MQVPGGGTRDAIRRRQASSTAVGFPEDSRELRVRQVSPEAFLYIPTPAAALTSNGRLPWQDRTTSAAPKISTAGLTTTLGEYRRCTFLLLLGKAGKLQKMEWVQASLEHCILVLLSLFVQVIETRYVKISFS